VFPKALHSVDRKQFLEFARKSHAETMQWRRGYSSITQKPTIHSGCASHLNPLPVSGGGGEYSHVLREY
jgi:hypothetical protein